MAVATGRSVSRDPGRACRHGTRVDPAPARQALGGAPEVVRLAAVHLGGAPRRTPGDLSARGGRCIRAVHGARRHAPLVPVAVQLPSCALLGRVDHDRRSRRASGCQVGDDARRTVRRQLLDRCGGRTDGDHERIRPPDLPGDGLRRRRGGHGVHGRPDRLAAAQARVARSAPTRHRTARLPGEPHGRHRRRGRRRAQPGLSPARRRQGATKACLHAGRAARHAAARGDPSDLVRRGVEHDAALARCARTGPARSSGRRVGRRGSSPFTPATSCLPVLRSQPLACPRPLEVNGEPLGIDHGYPLRLIGPNRPGVMQTKWVTRLVVR